MRLSLPTLLAPFALAATALAQGADNCASAQPIAGTGTFPFTNVGATNDGLPLVNCTAPLNSDVWFAWTAPATATFAVQTCSQTTLDTVMAVYGGTSCPATNELACNDDTCSLQSRVAFSATAGASYLIRLGSFSTTAQGAGNIQILQGVTGGADLCANAQPIAGTGTFPWSNIGAATDGGPLVNCTAIPENDIWFAWTAPATDQYVARTCSLAGLDTVMAVYAGTTCPATAEIACNDDACALQSSVSFAGTAGATYLIRLGSYDPTETDFGFLEVIPDPCNPATNDDGLEQNDDCGSATVMGDGSTPNLWVSKSDHDWYAITVPDQSTLQIDLAFTHAIADVDMFLYDACNGNVLGASVSVGDSEQILYGNNTGGPVDTRLEVYVYVNSSGACNLYDMTIQGSTGGLGTKYCTANSNSTGAPADLSATGSASSSAGNLTLGAAPVPNQNGIFFHAVNQTQVSFGNGFLCANGNIVRSSVTLASGNQASYTYDNSDAKHSLGNFVGTTRNFQFWYRDPMGGGSLFNTSNGLSIAIQP